MSYNIYNPDGSIALVIPNQGFNNTTSLMLGGVNTPAGTIMTQQNLYTLLHNNASAVAPATPIAGQTWFDTTRQSLNVFGSGSFSPLLTMNAGKAAFAPKIKTSMWQSTVPFWGLPHANQPATVALTAGANFSLDGDFQAIQLIFANPGVAQTLPGAICAATATAANRSTPINADGSTGTWTVVTINGASALALPAATSSTQPSITLSDIIPISSLPRTDGGKFPILMTRVATPSSGSYDVGIIADPAITRNYNAINGGRTFSCYYAGGDYVTSPATRPALNDADMAPDVLYAYVVGVRYLSTKRVVTILGTGDSLTAGFETTCGFNGFGLQASVQLTTPTQGVSYVAHGFPGQLTVDFVANAKTMIAATQPHIITIPIDSPNDYTGVTTNIETCRLAQAARLLDLCNYASSMGTLPVLLTPIPFATYDTLANYGVERVEAGNLVRSLSAANILTLDAQSIISGYVPTLTRPPSIQPSYLSPLDSAHLSDAGQGAIGTALASLLKPIISA